MLDKLCLKSIMFTESKRLFENLGNLKYTIFLIMYFIHNSVPPSMNSSFTLSTIHLQIKFYSKSS